MFSPEEVREVLGLVLERIRDTDAESQEDSDGASQNFEDEDFNVEERPWSAKEVAEHVQILSEAAGVNWREGLVWAIQSIQSDRELEANEKEAARRHVIGHTILSEKHIARLSAYERQIMASLRSFYTLLERARAYRLGTPLPPPVSVDVTVSKGHDANGV
jgi:hypothetical protein